MKDRKREIGHRPAEERERVCIRILLLLVRLLLGFTGHYVSSVLACHVDRLTSPQGPSSQGPWFLEVTSSHPTCDPSTFIFSLTLFVPPGIPMEVMVIGTAISAAAQGAGQVLR